MIDKLYQYDWRHYAIDNKKPVIYKHVLPVIKETREQYYLDERMAHACGIYHTKCIKKCHINTHIISNSVFLDHEDDDLAKQLILQFKKRQVDIAKANFDNENQQFNALAAAPIETNDPYYYTHISCIESNKSHKITA